MLLALDDMVKILQDNFSKKIYPMGFPFWFSKVGSLLNNPLTQKIQIGRHDWSRYVSEHIKAAQENIVFHLDWPLIPQDMRKNVLQSLQDAVMKGLHLEASFHSQRMSEAGWPLFMKFENSNNARMGVDAYEKTNNFSFVIIDNTVILQAPSKAYHNQLQFFEIPNLETKAINQLMTLV